MSTKVKEIGYREARDLIDTEAEMFRERTGKYPKVLKLPLKLACDLANCTRDEASFISNKTGRMGPRSLDGEFLDGMRIQLVQGHDAKLDFE